MTSSTQTDVVVYDDAGRITMVASLSSSTLSLYEGSGMNIMLDQQANPDTQWVDSGAITDRPPNPATLSGMTLTNVPVPSTLIIDTTAYAVTESTVDLSFTYPGTYTVQLKSFPNLDKTFTVTV